MTRIGLIVLLWIALLPGPVLAQDAQDPQQAAEQQSEQARLDGDLSEEELAAAENDELVLENPEASDAEEEGESSSRFIPTEQISQDLGVSFPVDI